MSDISGLINFTKVIKNIYRNYVNSFFFSTNKESVKKNIIRSMKIMKALKQ